MSETPVPTSLKRTVRRRAAVGSEQPTPRTPRTSEGLHRVAILAPDPECAAMLLAYASPLFPAEIASDTKAVIHLQPPPAGSRWVIELLSLLERWLEAVPLPCVNLIYGGRNYLIRSSTHIASLVAVEPTDSAAA